MTASDQQFSLFDLDLDPVVEDRKSATTPSGRFSNFIVYVDESGDHGMQTVDPNYPLFVLAFCVFYKRMARPVGKRFFEGGMMVCINVSGLKADALAKMDIRAVWSS